MPRLSEFTLFMLNSFFVCDYSVHFIITGTIDKKHKFGRRIMNICSSIVLQNVELKDVTEFMDTVTQKGYCAVCSSLKTLDEISS